MDWCRDWFTGAEEASRVWRSASVWADVQYQAAGGQRDQCPGNCLTSSHCSVNVLPSSKTLLKHSVGSKYGLIFGVRVFSSTTGLQLEVELIITDDRCVCLDGRMCRYSSYSFYLILTKRGKHNLCANMQKNRGTDFWF